MSKPSRVSDFMTEDVVTLRRDDEIALADDLMNLGRVRHIPVVDDDDALVGILTQRDLFRSALIQALGASRGRDRALSGVRINMVMTTEVVTASPATSIRNAAELMHKQKIGCLPVLLDGSLVGILTEADFVRACAEQ